uniref:Isochorismatase domain containing 2 n=1 Tax=Cyprinus carpio TaxID=7962 RepID=A0A8C2BND6_CYPCA
MHKDTEFEELAGCPPKAQCCNRPTIFQFTNVVSNACRILSIPQILTEQYPRGMEVHIVADAVSSRSHTDHLFALPRLKQNGAFLTTTEGVLLQLVQDAKHPNCKEIQKLLAHPSPDTRPACLLQLSSLHSHTPHPADIITSITRSQHKPLSKPVRSHVSYEHLCI